MRITPLTEAGASPRRSLAIGTFDGVHVGHREVIRSAATVVTFEPHPGSVISPARAPLLLTPLAVKADLIASLGVEELIVVRFDAAFASLEAQRFIDEVIVGRL